MESIEIKSVTTSFGSAKINDIIHDVQFEIFDDAFRKWKDELDRTGIYNKHFSFSVNDINRIDKILFFPENHLFEVYSKDKLITSISSKDFKCEYK
jgi:hypothetical protein